jgi:CyaY protein
MMASWAEGEFRACAVPEVAELAEVSYAVRAERLLGEVLDQLESQEALEDLELDLIDGVLTLEFEDGTQLILNRQEPLEQIWLASPLGPAHFRFDQQAAHWVDDRTGEALVTTLGRALSQKLGIEIQLSGGF